jgi:hypothetical protein
MTIQQKLCDEKAELDAKLGRLLAFGDTATFDALDSDEQNRLVRQSVIMCELSRVLCDRINAIGGVTVTPFDTVIIPKRPR